MDSGIWRMLVLQRIALLLFVMSVTASSLHIVSTSNSAKANKIISFITLQQLPSQWKQIPEGHICPADWRLSMNGL
jgi:hypothetical protein